MSSIKSAFTRRRFLQNASALATALGFGPDAQTAADETGGVDMFVRAKPIWPKGRETERNLFVGFHHTIKVNSTRRQPVTLKITASTIYRAFLNGKFVGYGPARGPHGYVRVDEWGLDDRLSPGTSTLAIEVAGYNVNSYYWLDQPSFLQAEVLCGDQVLAATGAGDVSFAATMLTQRVQRVQRYSFQRPFTEAYVLTTDSNRWRSETSGPAKPEPWSVLPSRKLLARNVSYPRFLLRQPLIHLTEGRVEVGAPPANLLKDRSLTKIGPQLKGFKESELETTPSIFLQGVRNVSARSVGEFFSWQGTVRLEANSYSILDFATNLTGFVGATVECRQRARVFFTFDEILSDEDVDFKRLDCVNAISYELEPGSYDLESFEPYTLRFLKLTTLGRRL
jgi:alpha-L-rhamnosidase